MSLRRLPTFNTILRKSRLDETRVSILDERFQSCQGILPLVGNAFEVGLKVPERLRPELEQALAPDADAVHDPRVLQHAKMLRDRLSRERRAFREPGDRLRRAVGQLCNE